MRLEELLKAHKNLQSIPSEDLTKVGYERIKEQDTIIVRKKDAKQTQKQPPFDKLQWQTQLQTGYRTLAANELRNFERRYNIRFDPLQDALPHASLLYKRLKHLSTTIDSDIVRSLSWFYFSLSTQFLISDLPSAPPTLADFGDSNKLHPNDAQRLVSALDTYQSALSDKDQYKSYITRDQTPTNMQGVLKENDDSQYLKSIMHGTKFKNPAQVLREILGTYVQKLAMNELANELAKAHTFDTVMNTLTTAQLLPSYSLQKNLKKAVRKNRQTYSRQLALAKQQYKQERQLTSELRLLFSPWEILGEALRPTINSYIAKLKATTTKSQLTLTLDGMPDLKLDANPGALIHDCTAGRSLPFHLPSVHNVKVYDSDHIGNIYLFEVTINGEPAWHLDAIQVPRRLDWTNATKSLVTTLTAAAPHITYLTVGVEADQISNFDYVGKGVIEAHKITQLGTAKVVYSSQVSRLENLENNRFSTPQNDTARILWQRK